MTKLHDDLQSSHRDGLNNETSSANSLSMFVWQIIIIKKA